MELFSSVEYPSVVAARRCLFHARFRLMDVDASIDYIVGRGEAKARQLPSRKRLELLQRSWPTF